MTLAGRLRLIQRCEHRPLAHVAAEAAISRQCLSKWKNRYDALGEIGLADRSSAPIASPSQIPAVVIASIADLRRDKKLSARLITVELAEQGHQISQATVSRWLVRLGLNRRRDLDPRRVE